MVLAVSPRWEDFLNFSLLFFGLFGLDIGEYHSYGMIATGFREPDIPLFCLHEYKRSVENQGTPDAQVLAAMLVAQELNQRNKPIYGLYVVGLIWNFVVLKDNEYCISKDYTSDDENVFLIFKMLKALKQIIQAELPL